MTRVVVVGNGMVGSRFVEDLLAADTAGRFTVTVLGAEACEPYNRVLLSEVLAGRYGLGSLTLPTPQDPRLDIRLGTAAVAIDRGDRSVLDTDGVRHRYDRLVLATGAAARIPPLRGLAPDPATLPRGVHPLRTIDDAREIVAATLNARRAVVLGAGVLGLEAACGLADRGVHVTVVHPAPALMERQLDGDASRAVEAAMGSLGIEHRVGVGAEEVVLADGALTGVRLADGEVLAAQLLVLATGTVAATALAADAGLATDRGVLVTDALSCAADRRIHAIGDCAQPPEGGSGLVAQGWDQARRLAALLSGAAPAVATRDATGNDVVRLKANGLDVVTMGVCGSQRPDDKAHRQLRLSDPAAGRHVEVVVSDGVLVGATCVGDAAVGADLVATYTRRTPVPADPAYLLLPALPTGEATTAASPADLPDSATVCRCNSVTKGAIAAQWEHGSRTVEELAATTRATTGCGGCTQEVCDLLTWLGGRTEASQNVPMEGEMRFTPGKHTIHSAETSAS
ncbi:assimilatory nitrate reductase (NADH) beta subunit [Pedococcus cremeus]|uniref:Assimilatory nitrate reductase (NADH) beta subunit n=1 Tax=Pedococcus cremeus TaxID=587636 RepID=A0A1H9UJI0_9MICO|nr:FAD-dependent oxidoreductase [Pedococcus cremeus]SES09605.1 assimilatory nitrate reductase (NADH) beta subunit [Pedococcus cremeus]